MAAMASSSALPYITPVGLDGEFKIKTLALGLKYLLRNAGVILKAVDASVGMTTDLPPAALTISG